jgi:uncharacterized protein (TIGR03437 family)
MRKHHKISVAKIITICAAMPFLLYAFVGGPDPRKTGAPGDSTCAEAGCHVGTAIDSGPGTVTITYAGGTTYTPGARQRVTVRVEDPNQRRWGFQATARLSSNASAGQAGSLDSTDANTQVICEDGRVKPCRDAAPVQFVEHTEAGTRNGTTGGVNFEFDWTAPAAGAGPVVLYVAANAANGNGTNAGDRIYTTSVTLNPAAGGGGPKPAISQNGVKNAASFATAIAPKGWFFVQGADFGESFTSTFQNGQYPTDVNGLRVLVADKPAYLYFSNGTQINALVPDDIGVGDVPVVVVRGDQRSEAAMVRAERFSPGFFPWPQDQPVATDANFAYKAKAGTFETLATTPAKPGDVIILWGTGFGPTAPDLAAGQQVPSDTIRSITNTPTIRIGDVPAEYLGGALAPGFSGLYQIVIRVPGTLQDGDHPVVAEVGGLSSPATTKLTVQR